MGFADTVSSAYKSSGLDSILTPLMGGISSGLGFLNKNADTIGGLGQLYLGKQYYDMYKDAQEAAAAQTAEATSAFQDGFSDSSLATAVDNKKKKVYGPVAQIPQGYTLADYAGN